MDPEKAWGDLLDALEGGRTDEASKAAEGLATWFAMQGFPPRVSGRAGTPAGFERHLCQAGCAYLGHPSGPFDTRYQGRANYATFVVHLWLTSDDDQTSICRALAEEAQRQALHCSQVREETWTVEDAERFLFADRLKSWLNEEMPLGEGASLWRDLLTAALQEVAWEEIARHFLEGTHDDA